MISELEKLAHRFLEKTAQATGADLTGTIERAGGQPEFHIPNFRQIISIANKTPVRAVKNLTINLLVKSANDVSVSSVLITPTENSVASSDDFKVMIDGLKDTIPKYFSKNWETIKGIAPGDYVASYDFDAPVSPAS